MFRAQLASLRRSFRNEHPNAGYRYDPRDGVVADFAEFANMPIDAVEARIRVYHKNVRQEWRALGRQSFARRSELFYGSSNEYVFDIVHGTRNKGVVIEKLNKFNTQILRLIREHPGTRLLDFGGGTGVFCEVACELGKDVTYLDVPGRLSDFAAWRFAKYGLPITVQVALPERPTIAGKYDIVYSDAVLEHLAPEKQIFAIDAMSGAVTVGGLLIVLVDLSGPTRGNPTHSAVDVNVVHGRIEGHGFSNVAGNRHFCSAWRKSTI
jgi:2-polyprenyl-3-methyl-5-hydroxy-6-metoxy-1,4-benzoquinol methylase